MAEEHTIDLWAGYVVVESPSVEGKSSELVLCCLDTTNGDFVSKHYRLFTSNYFGFSLTNFNYCINLPLFKIDDTVYKLKRIVKYSSNQWELILDFI